MSYSVRMLDTSEWAEDGFPVPRKAYVASDDDASTIVKLVYTREQYEKAIADIRENSCEPDEDDIVVHLCPLRYVSGGPGRAFANFPSLRVLNRSVVVTQFRGLDI